jgi:hypothetical protein
MNVCIRVVDDGPTPLICFGSGSVVRTRRMIK